MFTYNEHEFDFDPQGLEDMTRYDLADSKLTNTFKQLTKVKSGSDALGGAIEAFDTFVNDVFGEGTADRVFPGKKTSRNRVEFIAELKAYMQRDFEAITKKLEGISFK